LSVFSAFLLLPIKTLASNPPSQSQSLYSSPGTAIPADGVTTGTITVNLKDSDGNYVTGDTIALYSTNNSTAVFNNTQVTGASGNATFTITSTTIGTTKVTLTDNTNSATFTDWFTVTFYSASLGCSNIPAAPVLTSVISNSDNKATLTWTDSANPVSNYLVSYGIAPGKYIYGYPNIGGQGTTSFTVGALSGNKKYYFVIAASNNCGASGFSNEMSVIVKPLPATPTPAPLVTVTPSPSPTPQSVVTVVAITPTPEEISSTPAPEAEVSGNSTIKTAGIILSALGIVLIVSSLIILKIAAGKRQEIPPIHPDILETPPEPSSTLEPPIGENPPPEKQ